MNAIVPDCAKILAPLLGKLGSPHDGEVVAAARAIGRQLERNGLSWNDLGRALEGGPGAPVLADPERDHWREMVDFCSRRDALLNAKEAAFTGTMIRVLRRPGGRPTPKQHAWLVRIFDRLAERAV